MFTICWKRSMPYVASRLKCELYNYKRATCNNFNPGNNKLCTLVTLKSKMSRKNPSDIAIFQLILATAVILGVFVIRLRQKNKTQVAPEIKQRTMQTVALEQNKTIIYPAAPINSPIEKNILFFE